MPVYYISILRARQSFDPCAFVLCASSRLYPIFCPLLSPPLCRNAFTRALLLVLPLPYFLPSFIVADMPQRFYPRFTACCDFPLFPACFLSPPLCRNAFARALPLAATFPYSPLAFYCRRDVEMFLPALCRLPRLYPIFCPLLSPPICRNAFARVLLFVESFPSPLFAFYRRHVPRFVRTSICAAFTCRFFPRPRACGRVLLSVH